MAKTLKRATSLFGQLLPAGTELTDEQADLVTNPKAFADAGDRTGPDANDARALRNIVRAEDTGAALRGSNDDTGKDDGEAEDRAAAGATLARGTKPAGKPAA